MVNYRKIDLEFTINSGQVFLWWKDKGFWYGVDGQNILKIDKFAKIRSLNKQKIDFFRDKDNLESILKSISNDKMTQYAVKKYFGLRLLRQDPFQCFISFIVSSNSNIKKIKNNLENICKSFGKKVIFDNKDFFLFPEPKILANASVQEMKKCGTGYRSNFIIESSELVRSNKINFEYLKKCDYFEAKEKIIQSPGVGNKVADCILLFSLDKLEAFPLDRWTTRILEKYYPNIFEFSTKSLSNKQYENFHEKITKFFGPYAGYSQQFLFKMERENYGKNWL